MAEGKQTPSQSTSHSRQEATLSAAFVRSILLAQVLGHLLSWAATCLSAALNSCFYRLVEKSKGREEITENVTSESQQQLPPPCVEESVDRNRDTGVGLVTLKHFKSVGVCLAEISLHDPSSEH